jgi:hypothetical protein
MAGDASSAGQRTGERRLGVKAQVPEHAVLVAAEILLGTNVIERLKLVEGFHMINAGQLRTHPVSTACRGAWILCGMPARR